jgi:hypothetical protein
MMAGNGRPETQPNARPNSPPCIGAGADATTAPELDENTTVLRKVGCFGRTEGGILQFSLSDGIVVGDDAVGEPSAYPNMRARVRRTASVFFWAVPAPEPPLLPPAPASCWREV